MVNLVSAFRSLGTGISNFFSSGFSKITNLFHRIFSRSTPQTSPPDLHGRVTTDGKKSPLLPKSTNGNPPAGAAAKAVQSGSAAKSAKPPKTKIILSPASTTKSSAAAVAISKGAGAGPALFRETPPLTVKTATAAAAVKPQASSALISTTVVKTATAAAGAGPALFRETPPFTVRKVSPDGNCFFHSLKEGLTNLKHPAHKKDHMTLRQEMVAEIRKGFSLKGTIFLEITDLREQLSTDFEGYKAAEKYAIEPGQRLDGHAYRESIIQELPAYIPALFRAAEIDLPGKEPTISETYGKLISGLAHLHDFVLAAQVNTQEFDRVIQSYLDTISKPCCQVNILSAEPLANKLNVAIVLHQNSQDYRVLHRVGPERGQEVHLVQAGSHFDLLIPN
jgi:hypothetical protein